MATRMQADADIDIIHNAMGAILDPSNQNGLTAKMIIDATRPARAFPARHTLPPKPRNGRICLPVKWGRIDPRVSAHENDRFGLVIAQRE